MEAIILCGLPASGKTTVAAIIAQNLGFRALGGTDILKEMAKERGYKMSGHDWWDTDEGLKFLMERKKNPDFDKETDRRVLEKIEEGDVVMTSYTAPWISKKGFKCWLSAPLEMRAQRMAKRDNIDAQESIKSTMIRDKENAELYKKLYGIDFGSDLSPFHLVIETDNIPAQEVAAMIIEAYKKRNKIK